AATASATRRPAGAGPRSACPPRRRPSVRTCRTSSPSAWAARSSARRDVATRAVIFSPAMPEDIAVEYAGYLRRFEEAVGPLQPGEFAKHNGKLIQKMAFAEFEPVYKEYMGLASHY